MKLFQPEESFFQRNVNESIHKQKLNKSFHNQKLKESFNNQKLNKSFYCLKLFKAFCAFSTKISFSLLFNAIPSKYVNILLLIPWNETRSNQFAAKNKILNPLFVFLEAHDDRMQWTWSEKCFSVFFW